MNNSTQFDSIVAGAGIWGCTIARRLAEAGKRVLVLEKRPVVGGNVRCEIDPETGIEIHKYGSHIFHTHIPEVWQFINRFTTFNGYQHKVLAWTRAKPGLNIEPCRSVENVEGGNNHCTPTPTPYTSAEGRMYHLPLGLTLINKFFGVELRPGEVEEFLNETSTDSSLADPRIRGVRRQTESVEILRAAKPPALKTNRDLLFEAFFRGYTSKQWGKAPEDIDPTIIKRVPVRNNYDTNYFNDYWQGIPSDGYNKMFERMLDHPNITVQCNCSLVIENDQVKVEGEGEQWINSLLSTLNPQPSTSTRSPRSTRLKIYYSGPIDALFNYKFGALPWRTLRFEQETFPIPDYQGTSVVNYPDLDIPYTRIHEFKHYHPEPNSTFSTPLHGSKTVIMREYSAQWQPGDEPYYPISTPESAALLARYQAEVEKLNHHCSLSPLTFTSHNPQPSTLNPQLIIGGRLGQYKYFDMDKSIEAALKEEIID